MENSAHSYTEQKPDFKEIAKMLHPDSTVNRAMFQGEHRLNQDNPAYTADQWRIETARINVANALEYFWSNYSASQSSEIERLTKENKELYRLKSEMFNEANYHYANYRSEIERLREALTQAQHDVNWMLNNQKLLNRSVFDYLDSALQPKK